jgi:RNA-directed DNA polymerase
MHYVFDKWMLINFPHLPFERYADDTICHCRTKQEAETMKTIIMNRLAACKLKLNEEKTRIVYCKDSNRKECHEAIAFDFLGYTFRPRKAKNSNTGEIFINYLPAISKKSEKHIHETIRSWQLNRKTVLKLAEIDAIMQAPVRGWINYYGKYYQSRLKFTLQALNHALVRWARRKFTRFKGSFGRVWHWLISVFDKNPKLFYHWQCGIIPCFFKLKPVQVRRAE